MDGFKFNKRVGDKRIGGLRTIDSGSRKLEHRRLKIQESVCSYVKCYRIFNSLTIRIYTTASLTREKYIYFRGMISKRRIFGAYLCVLSQSDASSVPDMTASIMVSDDKWILGFLGQNAFHCNL